MNELSCVYEAAYAWNEKYKPAANRIQFTAADAQPVLQRINEDFVLGVEYRGPTLTTLVSATICGMKVMSDHAETTRAWYASNPN